MNDFSFPTDEKLKSKKNIEKLFTEGKRVHVFPITLIYISDENFDNDFQIGVSVSKRYFKKAVDRNRMKRLLRECYRLQKHMLKEKFKEKTACFLLYQHNEKMAMKDLQNSYLLLVEKLSNQVQ